MNLITISEQIANLEAQWTDGLEIGPYTAGHQHAGVELREHDAACAGAYGGTRGISMGYRLPNRRKQHVGGFHRGCDTLGWLLAVYRARRHSNDIHVVGDL